METQQAIKPEKHHQYWWRILLVGIVLYFLTIAALVLTGNPNLFPTVVLVGNFLVPVTYVAFFYERRHLSKLSMPQTGLTFFYGGLLGVLAASVLEPLFISQVTPGSMFLVGLIEEFVKILGLYLIVRRWQHTSEMDGLILGAATGMGFAALESIGYAFTAFMSSGGSLSTTVGTTLLRGILSPVGHGTWTAILASVLFRESRNNRFRINGKVLGTYLFVSLLHSLWDGLPGVIVMFLGPGLDVFIGQSLVGGLGLFILWWRYREAKRLQLEASQAAELEAAAANAPDTILEPAAEVDQPLAVDGENDAGQELNEVLENHAEDADSPLPVVPGEKESGS